MLYGAGAALAGGRRLQLTAGARGCPAGSGRYGYRLLARDLDGDGYDDLVVAPRRPRRAAAGRVHVVFGGAGGLRVERSRVIRRPTRRPPASARACGPGDVDGDRRARPRRRAPRAPSVPGHATLLPRRSDAGPLRCRRAAVRRGHLRRSRSADVNGDGYADIVQGDSEHVRPRAGLPVERRRWCGCGSAARDGPRATPIAITQDSPTIPGTDEPGDEFGAVVEAGDMDSDGFADMIVAAMREDEGAGRVTVIRGDRDGYARAGQQRVRPGLAGRAGPRRARPRVRLDDRRCCACRTTGRLDVALAARGEDSADERVMVVEGGPGGVRRPTRRARRTLEGVASLVDAPPGGRIRLAKTAGS